MRRVFRQGVAIWLCAVLSMLSFAVASHSHDLDDQSTVECTLCVQQYQLNKTLPSIAFSLDIDTQRYIVTDDKLIPYISVSCFHYQGRAPPNFS